jgi:hypothetical protein
VISEALARAPTPSLAFLFSAFVGRELCFDNTEFPFPVNAGTNREIVEMVFKTARLSEAS